MEEKMFCVDCFYHNKSHPLGIDDHECHNPKTADLVTGRVGMACHAVRYNDDMCGEAGDWWWAKQNGETDE